MVEIAAQDNYAFLRQLQHQRLMSWSVPWHLEYPHSAVAKHVIVVVYQFGFDVFVAADQRFVHTGGCNGRESGIELGSIDDPRRPGKQIRVADMVHVEMGETDELDVSRRQPKHFQLTLQCDIDVETDPIEIDALRMRGNLVAESRIPQKRAAAVLYEKARVSHVAALTVVVIRIGKHGHVAENSAATVEGIESERRCLAGGRPPIRH